MRINHIHDAPPPLSSPAFPLISSAHTLADSLPFSAASARSRSTCASSSSLLSCASAVPVGSAAAAAESSSGCADAAADSGTAGASSAAGGGGGGGGDATGLGAGEERTLPSPVTAVMPRDTNEGINDDASFTGDSDGIDIDAGVGAGAGAGAGTGSTGAGCCCTGTAAAAVVVVAALFPGAAALPAARDPATCTFPAATPAPLPARFAASRSAAASSMRLRRSSRSAARFFMCASPESSNDGFVSGLEDFTAAGRTGRMLVVAVAVVLVEEVVVEVVVAGLAARRWRRSVSVSDCAGLGAGRVVGGNLGFGFGFGLDLSFGLSLDLGLDLGIGAWVVGCGVCGLAIITPSSST